MSATGGGERERERERVCLAMYIGWLSLSP